MSAREKWRQRQMRTRFIGLVRVLSPVFRRAAIARIYACCHSNDHKSDENQLMARIGGEMRMQERS